MPLPRRLLANLEPEPRDLRVVRGAWPADVGGAMSISAPHPRYFPASPHAFFGDGIHYRLSLRPGEHGAPPDAFAWRWHWVDNASTRLRLKRPDVFRGSLLGTTSPFGFTNAANTAPLPWGDRLFLTWDVGRPVEVDPLSMRCLGEVGRRGEWKEMIPQPLLPMVASTAHPVVDPEEDCLYTVNVHFGQLHVMRWSGEGALESWPVRGASIPQSLHTVTVTREFIVIADCAYKVEMQMLAGGERKEPNNESEPVYLVRKADLARTPPGCEVGCKVFRLAPEVMHYYALYDDSDGVQVVFEHTECTELALPLRAGDVDANGRPVDPRFHGLYSFPMTPSRTSLVRFDPETGRTQERARIEGDASTWSQQLSALDWSLEGLARPRLRHTVYHGWRPEAVTRRALALYGDRVDRTRFPAAETPASLVSFSMPDLRRRGEWRFALDELPSSPIYAPRSAGSEPGGHDGYLVVPVYSDAGFRVELFDAGEVGRGPLATLASPDHCVPFFIHSAWLERVAPAPDRERTRFADELDGVAALPDDLAATAREVARELDAGVPAE